MACMGRFALFWCLQTASTINKLRLRSVFTALHIIDATSIGETPTPPNKITHIFSSHPHDIDPTMSRRSARNAPPALRKSTLENLSNLKKRKVPADEVKDVSC